MSSDNISMDEGGNISFGRNLYSTVELKETGIRLLYIAGMYLNIDKISSIYVQDDKKGRNYAIIIQMTGNGTEKINLSGTTARLHMASMKAFLKEHLHASIAMQLDEDGD
jgi:hypothetical protein